MCAARGSCTISTHFGHQCAREHNRRNQRVVCKEAHIRPDGHYEVWYDEDHRHAYHRIFDKAVEKYNAHQSREDRRIKSYYNEVGKDAKKHPVYECIVGVYPKDGVAVEKSEVRNMLIEYVNGWQKANPNMAVVGIYYHDDESPQASGPHVHIDYIPVGLGYKRGLERQSSLTKALENMGYRTQGRVTAQMAWTKSENARLEAICRAHGLEVQHPLAGAKSYHIRTEAYKHHAEQLALLRQQVAGLEQEVAFARFDKQCIENDIAALDERAKATAHEIAYLDSQAQDIFEWADTLIGSSGRSAFQLYCEQKHLNYDYWCKALGLPGHDYQDYQQDNRTR